MIRCNLSVLLAERGLKISKVAADTGISRTTLTALSSNSNQGIQMSTLNTLCLYLGIEPNQLLSFAPVDIIPERVTGTPERIEATFTIRTQNNTSRCVLYGRLKMIAQGDHPTSLIADLTHGGDSFENYISLVAPIRDLPISFVRDIEIALLKKLFAGVLREYLPDTGTKSRLTFRVLWPTPGVKKVSEET